ncbi:hypothetical protein X975_06250, partial [Stegodyphus mimosarum]
LSLSEIIFVDFLSIHQQPKDDVKRCKFFFLSFFFFKASTEVECWTRLFFHNGCILKYIPLFQSTP